MIRAAAELRADRAAEHAEEAAQLDGTDNEGRDDG
jgi:hypothetical protein